MAKNWGGTVRSLDYSERWMRDGLRVAETAGGMCSITVDMTNCASIMRRLKAEGDPVKYAPVVVAAAARALARHPQLQLLVAGSRKLSGGRIDICLSIAGEEALTPIVLIEEADQKTANAIGLELAALTPAARSDANKLFLLLRRWGWLVPFGFLRRFALRSLLSQLWYRRGMNGMFQVTILPGVDFVAAQLFNTAGVLAVGAITERPYVLDGEIKVRLTAAFTCSIDHKQWNGMHASLFLSELRSIIEQETDTLFSRALASKASSA